MERKMAEQGIADIWNKARGLWKEVRRGATRPGITIERPIEEPLFNYFFTTQSAIEGQGAMDYHKYARRVYQELVLGEQTPVGEFESDPSFTTFESDLIYGLDSINMRGHTYPELADNLGDLIGRYGGSINSVALWSTGDAQATGYQHIKVYQSQIVRNFLREVRANNPEAGEFIREKTGYIVSDDKFQGLWEHLATQARGLKLVVLEDSRGNLRKVAGMVDKLNADRSVDQQIQYVPIWATYSREGIQAREKAEREGGQEQLQKEREDFNAIDSAQDLLNQERFGTIFKGADVFVDFDGVIGNNITMREAQAEAKRNALVAAVMGKRGVNEEEADKIIMDNLNQIKI